jgi:hypothetical protein
MCLRLRILGSLLSLNLTATLCCLSCRLLYTSLLLSQLSNQLCFLSLSGISLGLTLLQ